MNVGGCHFDYFVDFVSFFFPFCFVVVYFGWTFAVTKSREKHMKAVKVKKKKKIIEGAQIPFTHIKRKQNAIFIAHNEHNNCLEKQNKCGKRQYHIACPISRLYQQLSRSFKLLILLLTVSSHTGTKQTSVPDANAEQKKKKKY